MENESDGRAANVIVAFQFTIEAFWGGALRNALSGDATGARANGRARTRARMLDLRTSGWLN